jgi:hypothetical protein
MSMSRAVRVCAMSCTARTSGYDAHVATLAIVKGLHSIQDRARRIAAAPEPPSHRTVCRPRASTAELRVREPGTPSRNPRGEPPLKFILARAEEFSASRRIST